MTVTITKSPYRDDEDLPWSYSDRSFVEWVDEVFREGYKRSNPPMSVEEAMDLVSDEGYELEAS